MESQRLILFFVFSFSVFLLLDAWQRDQQPAPPAPAVRDKTEKAASLAAPTPVPSEKLAAAPGSVPQQPQRAPDAGKTIRVETDLLVAHLSTQGGDLRWLEFKKHRDTLDKNKPFVLFEATPERTYLAQAGLTGGKLPSHRTEFAAERESYQLA